MSWNHWIRQTHRWLSIVFTVAVIVTTIVLSLDKPPMWVSYLPLPPLFLLLFTGLYLFVVPYRARWRGERRAE
jgi:membrane protein CcdC involved in cytochrome C biogenesis